MKKFIRSSIDFENNNDFDTYDRVSRIVNDTVWDAVDNLVNSSLPQAQELEKLVPGYDSEWCPEEGYQFANEIKKVVAKLSSVITDNYFANK